MPLLGEPPVCPSCNASIPWEDWNREHSFCTACRAPLSAIVFRALFERPESAPGAAVMEAGESSCFYHPQKRAVVPCDQCGRFLCSLCQVDFLGGTWCPLCIDARRQKGQLSNLDAARTLYDNVALVLSTFPLLLIWPT